VKFRWLALSTLLACSVATAQVPQKMPVPVEDDPNAPAEMRGNNAAQTPPPSRPTSASTAPPEVSAPSSPYSQAMVEYKAGAYQKAFDAIQGIDPTTQDDNFVILEAGILAELKRYDDGEKLLKGRIQQREEAKAPAPQVDALLVALGDLLLHRHAYDRAAKFYQAALQDKPNDPDLTLKLVYAHIGDNDLRGADQLAATLNPFNPKDPYDDHAAYYFAQAALAQAIGHSGDAEDDIQQARTNFGVIVVNRYLKAYLEFFSQPEGKAPSGIAPAKP
jgi:tetratricopeptide (TPR) repeat protein